MILSLWIFLLLGMLAMSLAFRGRLETRIASIRQAEGPVPYAVLSPVNLARKMLEEDSSPDTDSLKDSWNLTAAAEGEEGSFQNSYRVQIEDEERKIHLNSVPPGVLEAFFKLAPGEGVRLETPPEDWIGGILY